MSKETFLIQLEQLLYDIPREEREEAVKYYRSYFEEAGADREADVLEELGSPQRIAAGIKEGLGGSKDFSNDFTKNSSINRSEYIKNPLQDMDLDTGRDTDQDIGRDRNQKERKGILSGMDRRTRWIFLIIIAVFTLPVWNGIACGILGVVGAAVAVVVALGIFAVSGVAGGLVCAVIGVVKLCMASLVEGLVVLGIGMLLIAGGGISIILFMLVCFKFLPWAVNQAASLCRRIWNWGRSMA